MVPSSIEGRASTPSHPTDWPSTNHAGIWVGGGGGLGKSRALRRGVRVLQTQAGYEVSGVFDLGVINKMVNEFRATSLRLVLEAYNDSSDRACTAVCVPDGAGPPKAFRKWCRLRCLTNVQQSGDRTCAPCGGAGPVLMIGALRSIIRLPPEAHVIRYALVRSRAKRRCPGRRGLAIWCVVRYGFEDRGGVS